jgi:hypothetical protein
MAFERAKFALESLRAFRLLPQPPQGQEGEETDQVNYEEAETFIRLAGQFTHALPGQTPENFCLSEPGWSRG